MTVLYVATAVLVYFLVSLACMALARWVLPQQPSHARDLTAEEHVIGLVVWPFALLLLAG